jgi:two-component SAPR family response regulator
LDTIDVISRGREGRGSEVHAFTSPVKALSHFRLNYFDAIVLDIMIPVLNGFELAKKIWQLDPGARICFFTAFEEYENEALRTVLSKNYCFIRKPIGIEALAKHIDGHLSSEAILAP